MVVMVRDGLALAGSPRDCGTREWTRWKMRGGRPRPWPRCEAISARALFAGQVRWRGCWLGGSIAEAGLKSSVLRSAPVRWLIWWLR